MLRVAVIGCRGIGVRHAQGVVEAGDAAELVAGCDLSEELGQNSPINSIATSRR